MKVDLDSKTHDVVWRFEISIALLRLIKLDYFSTLQLVKSIFTAKLKYYVCWPLCEVGAIEP